MKPTRLLFSLCLLFLLASATPARALIERLYSIDEVLKECTQVLVGRITKVNGKGRTAVVTIDRALKGEAEYKLINMNISLGPAHHAKYMMERLRSNQPAIVFYKREGKEIASLVHAGDTWFQLFATDDSKRRDKVWWRFTHIELYMGRTFNDSTPKLIDLTGKVLAKRAKSPKPNPGVPKLDLARRWVKARKPTPWTRPVIQT